MTEIKEHTIIYLIYDGESLGIEIPPFRPIHMTPIMKPLIVRQYGLVIRTYLAVWCTLPSRVEREKDEHEFLHSDWNSCYATCYDD